MIKKLLLCLGLPLLLFAACSSPSSEQSAVVNGSETIIEVFRAPT